MIKDKLLSELKRNFPKEESRIGASPEPAVVFQAKHPIVGDLNIWDDGDEVTVSIGDITHGHFDSFNSDLNQEEKESEIVEQVVNFIKAIFLDKYLLFKSGGSGGWLHWDYIEKPFKSRMNTEYFVWSGLFDVNSLK